MDVRQLELFISSHASPSPKGNIWIHTIETSRDLDYEIGVICNNHNILFRVISLESENIRLLSNAINYVASGECIFLKIVKTMANDVYTDLLNWKEYPKSGESDKDSPDGRLFLIVSTKSDYDTSWKVKRLTDFYIQYD